MGNIINCEEQVKDDDEENKCFDIITIMGNTVVGGGSNGAKSSKRNIEKKIEQASKTGVLNLVGMSLKPNSSVWAKIMADGTFVKIKTLDISENMLKTLPNEIFAMVNTKTLIASRCNLQRIPNMQALDKLTNLTLDNNDLEASGFGQLPISILKLNLSFNHLQSFPISLTTITELIELDLCNNRLDVIIGIGNLINLVVLVLDDNNLRELNNELGTLTKIKRLSVKRNKIGPRVKGDSNEQSISADLFTNTSLDDLNLEGNPKLTKAHVLAMSGVDAFMERRKKSKDKNFKGGAMVDHSIFGLD